MTMVGMRRLDSIAKITGTSHLVVVVAAVAIAGVVIGACGTNCRMIHCLGMFAVVEQKW
jgi:hypothetical protein